MEGLWWENVHKAASGLRNAIQLIQLLFDHKPVCASLCVPQIHLGDREGTVNILWYEPVRSGPSDILHRRHSAVTARRCRWEFTVSKVNPRWWKYIKFLVLSCCYEEILLIFRQNRDFWLGCEQWDMFSQPDFIIFPQWCRRPGGREILKPGSEQLTRP